MFLFKERGLGLTYFFQFVHIPMSRNPNTTHSFWYLQTLLDIERIDTMSTNGPDVQINTAFGCHPREIGDPEKVLS